MTHVSRPFQIGLAAVAVLAAVWLVALRGHSGSSGSGSSPAVAQQQAPQPSKPAPASSTPYSGSAPGIAGLTHAIEKARGAVALSERNAHQLQQQSDQASRSSADAATPAGTSSAAKASATGSATKPAAAHSSATKTRAPAAPRPRSALPVSRAALSGQAQVEGQLRAGKVVAILFWNPRAEVDQLVRSELLSAQSALRGQLAVEFARASQAGAFGTFTRAVQVLQTPTILLVNRRGRTSSLTGLADSFSLQQAISEARG
jgi:hypothetical protein